MGAQTVGGCAVRVTVYNDVHAPASLVERAQEVATEIYAKAGIDLVWVNGRKSSCETARPECEGNTQLSLRIVSRSLNLQSDKLGVAFLGADGTGMQADVFYSGIEELGRSTPMEPSKVLGHVMAHELGHLLLGLQAHSRSGIMQARWRESELHRMSIGLLTFSSEESTRMHTRLVGTTRVLALSETRGFAARFAVGERPGP